MRNAMQLKAAMKKLAKEKGISAQLVLQNYMLERFLERVSLSAYRDHFILKGGFLIASLVGLDSRATMDMDMTIQGYPVNEASVRRMIEEILEIPVEDSISFRLYSVGKIRERDVYDGFRVAMTAEYEKMAVPLKIDVTTGDRITPKEIEYAYRRMLDEGSIRVLAYPLCTILAEKLETVVSRGDQNTRPRDYYDIYILMKLRFREEDLGTLREALQAAVQHRGTEGIIRRYRSILQTVKSSEVMARQWKEYQDSFRYAVDIGFDEACDTVLTLMNRLIGGETP